MKEVLSLKTLEDWYNVKLDEEILKHDKQGVLNAFGGSLAGALKSAYPDHNWLFYRFHSEHVPFGFWNTVQNHKIFMDHLYEHLGFESMDAWYQLRAKDIRDFGGSFLLTKYYSNSPSKLLQYVYPEHRWDIWRFPRVPNGTWEQMSRDKWRELILWLSERLKIQNLDGWYRVSFPQIAKLVSGVPFERFSLQEILVGAFPDHPWEISKLQNRRGTIKASQRVLFSVLKDIFPTSKIFEDYPLLYKSKTIELDVYLPEENLAFEYHGQQHYVDIYEMGSRWIQRQRDEEKRKICKESNITLVEVPYWWDFEESSLRATLLEHSVYVSSKVNGKSIPKEPPRGFPKSNNLDIFF